MRYNEWFAQVQEWKQKYGVPEVRFDPTAIRAIKVCAKCGIEKTSKIEFNRHHLRFDFTFACLFPNVYARRYVEFRKDDIAELCHKDHQAVERYLKPLKLQFYTFLSNRNNVITVHECEEWREKFYQGYEKWLKKKRRKWKIRMRRRSYIS